MAEFITKCPHCNSELQVQDEWIGMEVECPLCHKMFAINKSSAIVETEKTEAVTNSALAADEKNCPFCNGIIKEQAIFCKHCKMDLNKTTTPQTQVESLFIFICPECDTVTELPESLKDKEYECPCCCETSIAREAVERNCPSCGEKIKIKATVCKHCNQKIKPIEALNTQKQGIKNLFSQKESSAKKSTVQPYTQASSTPPEPPVQETCGEGGSLSFCELLGSTWNILCCRPGVAIGFTALLAFIYLSIDICRFIISSLAQGNNIAIVVISLIFLLPSIFIQPVFLLWIQLNALLLRRNQEINPQSIFLYVKQNQWMHFLWGYWRPAIFIFLWSLLLIVPGLIACMKYIMTLFILLDNPELSVKEAMMHSAEITMGHKLKIFGALFVAVLISSGCTVLVQIITQSANIATIVGYGISIILMPFTSLFFAGIYERIRRS